jgi:lysophospholipase L1-like esterase
MRIVGVAVLALLPWSGQAGVSRQEPEEPIGVVIGDSVAHGFGNSPVLYNERSDSFLEDRYRFKATVDGVVEALAGYQGLQVWLNRGVTGNPSNSVLARWKRDISERLDRGFQKRTHRVRSVLVSAGLTDLAAAVGTPELLESEAKLRNNLLNMTRRAREEGMLIAFLQIPDPTKAPMGRTFRTLDGTTIEGFCESHEYDAESCTQFVESVQRTREFMDRHLRAAGADVIDYAAMLPLDYFVDSHHLSKEGYTELGRKLREAKPGAVRKASAMRP